jgi:choline-sulfatase
MPPDRPNVLILQSDQHCYRCLGRRDPESGEPVGTPALDRLFESGTSFENTYAQVPICTPSRISTLTGQDPTRCGAWGNGHMLPDEAPTIADAFGEAGYETCYAGKMHVEGDNQFAGFDHYPYGDVLGTMGHQIEPPKSYWEKDAPDLSPPGYTGVTGIPESMLQERTVAEESRAFLREHEAASDDPWLMYASFSRPHGPLTAPSRFMDRHSPDEVPPPAIGTDGDAATHPALERIGDAPPEGPNGLAEFRAAYFACVEFLDEVIGDFLAGLERDGLLDDTIVVYTSDHGDNNGNHGIVGKLTWHESSARVPLVIETPKQRAGDASRSVETPVGLVDLYPTLCGLSGVPIPGGVDGWDLSAAVETGTEPDRGPVTSSCLSPVCWGEGTEFRMVRDGRWKYVHHRDYPDALFDLEADPTEQDNLLPDPAGEAADAHERLAARVDQTTDWAELEAARERAEERVAERNLGIVDGSYNQYHLPDGRVVDADAPLYHPRLFANEPERLVNDFPDD